MKNLSVIVLFYFISSILSSCNSNTDSLKNDLKLKVEELNRRKCANCFAMNFVSDLKDELVEQNKILNQIGEIEKKLDSIEGRKNSKKYKYELPSADSEGRNLPASCLVSALTKYQIEEKYR